VNMNRWVSASIGAVLACAGLATQAAKPQQWTFVDLSIPGALGAEGKAVNDHGAVVGEATFRNAFGDSARHVFLWQDGVMKDLGSPPGGNAFVQNIQVTDVNDRGDIAVTQASNAAVPFLWKDGAWQPLSFMGSITGVNRADDAAGTYLPQGSSHPRALIYVNGSPVDVGTLGGSSAVAWSINNHDAVVGSSSMTGDTSAHAFMYRDGAIVDMGILPGGRNSEARDVNDHGVAVGTCDLPNDNFRTVACVFEAGKPARMLFDVPGLHEAIAINNRGDVVGDFFNGKSFLYKDGVVTQLEDLDVVKAGGWSLAPAGINDHGLIVGTAWRSGSYPHAFVLIPK